MKKKIRKIYVLYTYQKAKIYFKIILYMAIMFVFLSVLDLIVLKPSNKINFQILVEATICSIYTHVMNQNASFVCQINMFNY